MVKIMENPIKMDVLGVSTSLKNISKIGSFPQIGVKIKNIWNHHLVDDLDFVVQSSTGVVLCSTE